MPFTAAQAQEELHKGPQARVQMELLLGSDRVTSDSVSGPVWDVTATPGRRLVQLPMRILLGDAVEGEKILEEPAVSFQGGRFLLWEIPDDQNTPSRGGTGQPVGPDNEELLDLTGLLMRGDDFDERRGLEARGDGGEPFSEVPEIAPRLARELFISQADGVARVAWEVSRGFPGGEVKNGGEDQPYSLLLDRAQLEELEPARPERLTRNADESSREFTFRKRTADAEYREFAGAYRELQKMVRSLPDRFEQDLPETVWAVFEVNALAAGWTLRGHESGPWTMNFDDWELLTTLASGRGGGRNASGDGDYSTEELTQVLRLADMARDPHPWTQRLLATAIAQSAFPGKAAPDDVVSKLIEKLLQSPDTLARNRMVYALSRVEPATPAVSKLLATSARETRDPAIQLAALQAELALQLADADPAGDGLAGAIRSVNAMLADEDGADAGLVIEQFLATVPEDEQAQTAVIGGVRFDNLPKPRFDAAVAAVLSSAGERPDVVGGWVNLQLLGSSDPSVVDRTLDLLARADEPAPILTPMARGLRGLVFGQSSSAEVVPQQLMITSGIPLDSANHSLFRMLNSGDPVLRKKGWLVLRHFELTDRPVSSSRRPAPATDTNESDPLTMIVDAGLGDPQNTPSSLVTFLARQTDADRAAGPLLRVVIEGDQPASRHASRVLRGSERSFDSVLRELEPDARETFANRVYEALGDGPEPVTGLMRNESPGSRGGVIGWFAQALASGELPDPSAWGEAAGGESALMQAAVNTDEQLAAGAFAALTAMAGGDRELQYTMFERFKDERKTKTSQSMAEAWADARKDIYTQRLKGAAGEYRLVMVVTGLAPTEGGLGRASDPILGRDPSVIQERAQGAAVAETSERTTLGVMRLVADGRTLRFSSGTPELGVPENRLAIRVTTPGQLKAFDVQQIKDLPLEETDEPLDLLPQDQGVWRGTMILRDGRDFELVMEPWRGDEKLNTNGQKKSPAPKSGDLQNNPFN